MRPALYWTGVVAAGVGAGLAGSALADLALSDVFGTEPSPSSPLLAGGGFAVAVGGAVLGIAGRPVVRPAP